MNQAPLPLHQQHKGKALKFKRDLLPGMWISAPLPKPPRRAATSQAESRLESKLGAKVILQLRVSPIRPLKKCLSNAPGSRISKKRVAQTRLRNECEGHFGLFAGRFARFGRTYPMAHA